MEKQHKTRSEKTTKGVAAFTKALEKHEEGQQGEVDFAKLGLDWQELNDREKRGLNDLYCLIEEIARK